MTVKKITQIERYVGLSGDDKPTPSLVGSEFTEADTAKIYIWDGTQWRHIDTGTTT